MIVIDNGNIFVDAAVSENLTLTSAITTYPVESGANLADHIQNQPLVLALSCLVSNNPIGEMFSTRDNLGEDVPSVSVYDQLLALRDSRRAVNVKTTYKIYEDLVLTSLSIPRDSSDGLRFDAQFTQIKYTSATRETTRVTLPRIAKKKDLQNKPSPEAKFVRKDRRNGLTKVVNVAEDMLGFGNKHAGVPKNF